MRLRKHAKISQLADAAASSNQGGVAQTYLCQLNQSPWDAMTFSFPSSPPSPPPPQVDGGDARRGEVASDRRISVAARENLPKIDDNVSEIDKETAKEQCCKTDGKSWRCRREAAAGSSLCDHHLSLVKNYQNLSQNSTKKSENSTTVENSRRSTRSKIESWSLDSHEFYYYSGFRPGWSKKRFALGPTSNNSEKVNGDREKSNDEKPIDSDQEYSKDDEDDDDDDEEEDEDSHGEPAITASTAKKKKKRARKPVKARSLKSLM